MARMQSKQLVAGFAAVGLVAGLLVDEADARGRYRRPVRRHQCIFTPEYNSQGFLVPPANPTPEQAARFAIWSRDKAVHDHKLSFSESGLAQKDFAALDTNHDGYLDLKEMTAYFQSQSKGQTSGASAASSKSGN